MGTHTPALDRARNEARARVREEERLRAEDDPALREGKTAMNRFLGRAVPTIGGTKAERLEAALDARDAGMLPADTGKGLDQGARGGTPPPPEPTRAEIARQIDNRMRQKLGIIPAFTEEDE